MDAQLQYENGLLKRLFDMDGTVTMGGASDICYDLEIGRPLVEIRFLNGEAHLYESHRRGEWYREDTKKLSPEDIEQLESYGYKVR